MSFESDTLSAPRRASRRSRLIFRLASLVGSDLVTVLDAGNGWPGLVALNLPGGPVRVAVHIGEVGLSHRRRDATERRFQNPGKGRPMSDPADALPMLIGIWEDRVPLLVGMETEVRIARETRQSLFIPLALLERAEITGWAEHVSGSGELLIAFHPALLPVYVESRRTDLTLPMEVIADIATAAGLSFGAGDPPAERGRRVAWTLVRRAAFSGRVLDASAGSF